MPSSSSSKSHRHNSLLGFKLPSPSSLEKRLSQYAYGNNKPTSLEKRLKKYAYSSTKKRGGGKKGKRRSTRKHTRKY